jgi:hypothetical protein
MAKALRIGKMRLSVTLAESGAEQRTGKSGAPLRLRPRFEARTSAHSTVIGADAVS